jgi:hypothetical protein
MNPTAPTPELDDDELLIDGQEEVFSRTEVEMGRIEHHANTQVTPDEEGAPERPSTPRH